MTRKEENELLELTRQNNMLLSVIATAVLNNTAGDFIQNIIANLIANKMEGNINAQRCNIVPQKV